MTAGELIRGLPGEEMIREGLDDLQAGRLTAAACVATVGLPRLRRAGLVGGASFETAGEAELQLYRLLRQEGGDAYSRYNSLLRLLASFEQALDRRMRMASREQ